MQCAVCSVQCAVCSVQCAVPTRGGERGWEVGSGRGRVGEYLEEQSTIGTSHKKVPGSTGQDNVHCSVPGATAEDGPGLLLLLAYCRLLATRPLLLHLAGGHPDQLRSESLQVLEILQMVVTTTCRKVLGRVRGQ